MSPVPGESPQGRIIKSDTCDSIISHNLRWLDYESFCLRPLLRRSCSLQVHVLVSARANEPASMRLGEARTTPVAEKEASVPMLTNKKTNPFHHKSNEISKLFLLSLGD